MAEQTENKKFITFKPGIRKDFFKAVIFMAIFMGVMIGAMMIPGIGMFNGMAIGMSVMGILMTLSNDLTLEPVKNLLTLVGANVGMTLVAFCGYGFFPEHTPGRVALMTASTLVMFFFAIMIFNSEERNAMYMPLLLNFSMMIFYNSNTTGMSVSAMATPMNIYVELAIRAAIFAAAAVLAMLLNFMLHGRKFRKKIRATMDGAIKNIEDQARAIREGSKSKEELMKQSVVIEKTLTGVEGAMGTKMSIKPSWQVGHDMLRTITILKRINKSLTDNYVKSDEKLDQEVFELIEGVLEAIDDFENDRATQRALERRFDLLYHQLNPDVDHGKILQSLESEMEDFLEGEVRHDDKGDEKGSFNGWLHEHISSYSLVFALKNALLAALGVFFVELINCIAGHMLIPLGYMFPMYVGLTAQPYFELSKGSGKKRIINTIYAAVLILIAFSIPFPTALSWIHFIILIALTLIGDMFFQFDFMTMMGTMFAIIMNVVTNPSQLYSYTFWRVGYIIVICILVQIVDALIFPKKIPQTIARQVRQSLSVNNKLRNVIGNRNCTYEMLHEVITEKRRTDQCLRATNRYAKSESVTAYILADEEWLNRLTMINHRLRANKLNMGDLRDFVEANVDTDNQLNHRQKNILSGFDEALEDIAKSEELANAVLNPKTAAAQQA